MTIRYSEAFQSFQGEAQDAGVPAVWLRFFGCNFECAGFGQKDPTDPSTYVLPYQDFDLTNITRNEQLPVWKTGCDSSYSWSSKYRHLAHSGTPEEVAQVLIDLNKSVFNPEGRFMHPKTGQDVMVCFTGGEPMLYQKQIIQVLRAMAALDNMPRIVTVETNASRPLTKHFEEFVREEFSSLGGHRLHWAMSPKLFTASGEKDRIYPEIIASYAQLQIIWHNCNGTDSWAPVTSVLKFVCNGTQANWDELDQALASIRTRIDPLPSIWVMPVGARAEEQNPEFLGPLCREAMRRGYNIATRNQIAVFGNVVGS